MSIHNQAVIGEVIAGTAAATSVASIFGYVHELVGIAAGLAALAFYLKKLFFERRD